MIDAPDFDHHGRDGAWFWGVWAPGRATVEGTEVVEPHQACGIWLVLWNDAEWFYAPMGTEDLNRMAQRATQDLLAVPFADLPTCDQDA